jgi:multiple sugar transport system ATP-binding protein
VTRVAFRGVEKRFGDVVALHAFDLEVPDGVFLVILGPSGCGKTTALRVLAGLEEPTAGRVLLGERDVTRLAPRDRDVAMVFQSYALYPHMSVEENVGYPLRIRNVPAVDRARAVRAAAEALEIGHLLARRPRALSGGQRQRVALARAIVREPACFLMDEPLSNLDAKLRATMRGELKRLQKRLGATTLYVTHDQAEATTMADLVAVMRDGRLQQVAPPAEVFDRPANRFVATFVGNPPMTVLAGRPDAGRGGFVTGGGTVPLPAERQEECLREAVVGMGVRPEDLELVAPDEDGALRGEVYVVEPMGSETLVTVQLPGAAPVVRAGRGWQAPIGAAVGLRADPWAACFFDEAGETRVHRADEAAGGGAAEVLGGARRLEGSWG